MQGLQIPNVLKEENVSREDVINAIKDVMVGIIARHSTMMGPIEFVDVTKDGITFLDPIEIQPNWEVLDEDWAQ